MSNQLIRAYTTEKSSLMMDRYNKFTFLIAPSINKIAIKQYFKSTYNLVVTNVNIIKNPSKKRRRGRIVGFTKSKAKALISFSEGSDLDEIKKLF